MTTKLLNKIDRTNILEAKNYSCCNCTTEHTEKEYIQKANRIYLYKNNPYAFCNCCFNELWGSYLKDYENYKDSPIMVLRCETVLNHLEFTRWNRYTCTFCKCFRGKLDSTAVIIHSHDSKNVPLCESCNEHLNRQSITSTEKKFIFDVIAE